MAYSTCWARIRVGGHHDAGLAQLDAVQVQQIAVVGGGLHHIEHSADHQSTARHHCPGKTGWRTVGRSPAGWGGPSFPFWAPCRRTLCPRQEVLQGRRPPPEEGGRASFLLRVVFTLRPEPVAGAAAGPLAVAAVNTPYLIHSDLNRLLILLDPFPARRHGTDEHLRPSLYGRAPRLSKQARPNAVKWSDGSIITQFAGESTALRCENWRLLCEMRPLLPILGCI